MEKKQAWRTLKIPDPLLEQFARVMAKCRLVLLAESNLNPSLNSETLDVFEMVLCEAEHSIHDEYYALAGKLDLARLAAQERDGFRCKICRHSGLNRGGVESHHIIPRSHALEHYRLFGSSPDDTTNLITLCRFHHELVTNPPTPEWLWSTVAPGFYRAIGQEDKASAFEHERWRGNDLPAGRRGVAGTGADPGCRDGADGGCEDGQEALCRGVQEQTQDEPQAALSRGV